MVKHKDRESRISKLHIALRIAGINITYEMCELITSLNDAIQKNDDLAISQVTAIQIAWEEKCMKRDQKEKSEL